MKRGPGPTRKTPLTTKKGLTARTELSPGGGLTRRSPPPGGVHPPRTRPRPPRADGRGDPIPRDLADYIIERAEGFCDWCGRYCLGGWYSRQHRQARGMGGRGGAHTAANLVLLCGSATSPGCHERCEHSDIPGAQANGFRLKDGQDPETTPIYRHGSSWVLPTSEGWVPAPAPS